jgi:hypothetical protein
MRRPATAARPPHLRRRSCSAYPAPHHPHRRRTTSPTDLLAPYSTVRAHHNGLSGCAVRPCALGPLSVSSRRRIKEFVLQRRPGACPPFSSRPQEMPNLAPSRGMEERQHQRGPTHPTPRATPRRWTHPAGSRGGAGGAAAARHRR